tara:strand:- start:33 stop:1163 length:1131 start_codon:yes stop_codon:yes gene_type:complete
MGIYRRNNSNYWQYKDAKTKQRSTGVKIDETTQASLDRSKRKAGRVVDEWKESAVVDGIATKLGIAEERVIPIKVKQLIPQFLARLERSGRYKPGTQDWHKSLCRRITKLLGDHYLYHPDNTVPQINKATIVLYDEERSKTGADARKTRHDEGMMIKRLVNEAILRGHWPEDRVNPVDLIKRISPEFYSQERSYEHKAIPTEIMQEAIQNATREIDQLYWSLMFYTGLDSGDAGTLTKENVLSDRIVKLRAKQDSQIKKERWQVVPLHPSLQGMSLTNIMPDLQARAWSRTKLQALTGGHKCKNDTGYCLKCIRHTFATNLTKSFHKMGLSDNDVSLAMGHQSNEMTARYVHLERDYRVPLPEHLVEAIQILPALS